MTIDEAKYELDYCIRDMIEQKTRDEDKALDIAIKSLEALKEIKYEIQNLYDLYAVNFQGYSMDKVGQCLAIVNRHLKEVEE